MAEGSSQLQTVYAAVDNELLQQLYDANRNKNTEKSTATLVSLFHRWQQVKGVDIILPDISPKRVLMKYISGIFQN